MLYWCLFFITTGIIGYNNYKIYNLESNYKNYKKEIDDIKNKIDKSKQCNYEDYHELLRKQKKIDKIEEKIDKLETNHYNYEYLSNTQNNINQRLDTIYRDIKDDIARLNKKFVYI